MTKPKDLSPVKIPTDYISEYLLPEKKDFENKGNKIMIHYNEILTYGDDEFPITNKDFERIKSAIKNEIKLISLQSNVIIAVNSIKKISPKTKTLEIKPWTSILDIELFEKLKRWLEE